MIAVFYKAFIVSAKPPRVINKSPSAVEIIG